MKRARTNKRKRKEKWNNRVTLLGITFVVLSMMVVLQLRSNSLKRRDLEYSVKEEHLELQVAGEKLREQELNEQRIYVQTKQYIEKVAKEKLGLVYPDEILLKPVE